MNLGKATEPARHITMKRMKRKPFALLLLLSCTTVLLASTTTVGPVAIVAAAASCTASDNHPAQQRTWINYTNSSRTVIWSAFCETDFPSP